MGSSTQHFSEQRSAHLVRTHRLRLRLKVPSSQEWKEGALTCTVLQKIGIKHICINTSSLSLVKGDLPRRQPWLVGIRRTTAFPCG